jgi:hypothetical protein
MTLLIAPLIGIASALLTILLTPTLQHYFWRRQRHAERQLAVIDEMQTLAAELLLLVLHQPEEISARREQLYATLFKVATSVESLFSDAAWERFHPTLRSTEDILQEPPPPEQRIHVHQVHKEFLTATVDALAGLYQDMGILAPVPRQWMRTRIRQP